jgi:hypothetical protein
MMVNGDGSRDMNIRKQLVSCVKTRVQGLGPQILEVCWIKYPYPGAGAEMILETGEWRGHSWMGMIIRRGYFWWCL